MTTFSLRRKTLLLLLCATIGTPWASAATPQRPRATKTAAPASLSFLGAAWSFLQSLWGTEGCVIDPDGRCRTTATPASPKRLRQREPTRGVRERGQELEPRMARRFVPG